MKKTRTTAFIFFVFRLIPLGVRKIMFRSLLMLFYYISPRHRLIAIHNLSRSFPEKSVSEIISIAKGSFRHIGIMAAEFFEIPYITKANVHKYVEFDGFEHIKKALEKKKGVLSILAHFGNWELMSAALPLGAQPVNIIYRPLDSPLVENLIGWTRTAPGNALVPKEGSIRKTIRLLAKNQIMAILIDQNVAVREGIFIDFFGRPACTGIGLAVLALNTEAPVLPCFMIRMKDGRYKCLLQPAVEIVKTGDSEEDIRVNTQNFNRVIEDIVRQYPDQYFWVHQRWKTRPCQKE